MNKILLLGKGISNNSLEQFLIKYLIDYDYLSLEEVNSFNYLLVVKSPGTSYDSEVIKEFTRLGVDVIVDVEFIYWFLNKYYIAVTGTNGKTMTTYLITDILNLHESAISCGNCGFPIAQAALEYQLYKYFVLELSSFQLKGIKKFTPKIAVVTNLGEAHLDYHHTLEDYYNSKFNITKNQSIDDFLVLNFDDLKLMERFNNSNATKLYFSINNQKADCFIKNGYVYYKNEKILNIKVLPSKTKMFYYDVLAAIVVAKILDVDNLTIKKALKNFVMIKYRLQRVRKDIYNDAKSTNLYSTIAALDEFKGKKVNLICGGYDRGEDLSKIGNRFSNVSCFYIYGQTKYKLSVYFEKMGYKYQVFDNLENATIKALKDKKEEVILYSPMFASYDQYQSYEERGKEFNRLIIKYYDN